MAERMTGVDAAWLHMDRRENTADVVATMTFEDRVAPRAVRRMVEEKLLRHARFRQRVIPEGPLRIACWDDDPAFALGRHFERRTLPRGGTRALQAFTSAVASEPLDPAHPLWRVFLVDGFGAGSAIVVASIDSPLGSLSASFVTDIYRPLLVRGRSERHYLFVSRVAVIVFGIVLGALAYAFSFFDRILWLAFKIAGVTFGSLLGVFLLGLLGRGRVGDVANVTAMVVMAAVNLVLLVLSEAKLLGFAWSWLVILGTAGTMALALGLTALSRR